MKIYAIVNRRGGVGKTATTHAIGAGFTLKGKRVLFIDLDSQCNLTFDTGAKASALSALEVLTGTATTSEAIQTLPGGADIIPAAPNLAGADNIITDTGKEYRLREALERIAANYDYCIIDTPPALNVLTVNALTACDEVIIPAQAEVHSLQGVGFVNEIMEPIKKYCNPKLTIKGILITRYNGRTILSQGMKSNLEELAEALGTKVFNTIIRECNAIKEAQAMQADVFTYAPKSNAASDYGALLAELME